MNNPHRLRTFQLALIASVAVGLGACSKTDTDLAASTAASAPTPVAIAPTVAPNPAPAPVVVAKADTGNAYEQGRRDQQQRDARRERAAERQLPPRADRDVDVAPTQREIDQQRRHDQQVAAAQCHECGVVESVTAVTVQGDNKGIGAVAGGVGGAVVGNRIAGNNNRALGGIVGAVGGGLIGNAIEKHQRKATVYDVRVHMDDGTTRTVRESTSPAIGEKVRVEADGLHDRG